MYICHFANISTAMAHPKSLLQVSGLGSCLHYHHRHGGSASASVHSLSSVDPGLDNQFLLTLAHLCDFASLNTWALTPEPPVSPHPSSGQLYPQLSGVWLAKATYFTKSMFSSVFCLLLLCQTQNWTHAFIYTMKMLYHKAYFILKQGSLSCPGCPWTHFVDNWVLNLWSSCLSFLHSWSQKFALPGPTSLSPLASSAAPKKVLPCALSSCESAYLIKGRHLPSWYSPENHWPPASL